MKFSNKILIILFFSSPMFAFSQDSINKKHAVVLDAFGPSRWFSFSYERTFIKRKVVYEVGFGLGYGGRFSSKLGPNMFYLMPYFNIGLNKKISPFISICYTPCFDPYELQHKQNYACPSLNSCPSTMLWSFFSERIGISIGLNKLFLRPYYCGLIDVKTKTHYSWFGISIGYNLF